MITETLLNEIEAGRTGHAWGYSMGLPKLESIVDGVTRGTYTLLFADSGQGKSSAMLFCYVYVPIMEHLNDDNFKVTLFALEMKAEIILAKLLSTYIFEKYGIIVSFKELLSKKRHYKLSDELFYIVQECVPWMKRVEEILTIHDKGVTADSLYAILMTELSERGVFTETETRKIYTPNNPELIHLVIIDHAGLISQAKGRTKKQEIDLVSNYLVTLRNMCNISPLMIMQSNRDQSSSARRQLGFFLPQKSDVKETNGPVEDAEIILAVYNPANDSRATHNGYDIKQLNPFYRSIVCLKNRYGESNIEDGCLFYGNINIWRELPSPETIYDYSKYLTPDWILNKVDNKNNLDNNSKNINFTL